MIEGLHQVRMGRILHPLTHGLRQLVLVGDAQDREVRDQRQLFWQVDDDEVGRLVGGEMCV